MPCYSPLKGWKSATTGGLTFKKAESAATRMEVNCGQCLGCRLDYSRMWSVRIVHEAGWQLHEMGVGSCFITLTYRDDDIPQGWSLTPSGASDFQLFMKRLRRSSEQKIRFFMVGEYGSICRHDIEADDCEMCCVGRPHYHAVLFGKTFEDLEVCGGRADVVYYTSRQLEAIWGLGFVQVGEVNVQSADYAARYALKKITGEMAAEHYQNITPDGEIYRVQPEYATMSRRPGIGADWFEKYKDDCFPSDEVPVDGLRVLPSVPRYYGKRLEVFNPQMMEEVKESRRQFRRDNIEEYSPERLKSKYIVKKKQISFLKREL